MIQAPQPIDGQTLTQMRNTWSASHDVPAIVRLIETGANRPVTARQVADYFIAAFHVSPIIIGVIREWKDGRMGSDDFQDAVAGLIDEVTSKPNPS